MGPEASQAGERQATARGTLTLRTRRKLPTFLPCQRLSGPGGSIDVPCALEVDVFLYGDQIGGELPNIFSVIDDADH